MKKVQCKFCPRKLHPKGIKAHERAHERAHARGKALPGENQIPLETQEAIEEVAQVVANDVRVERILDGIWKTFSLNEKVEALHGLFFDPSNPDDE